MSKYERLLKTVLSGRSDASIRFDDLRILMQHPGFEERTRGSHHIYKMKGLVETVNLQRDDGNAKSYQVRQVRRLILKYKLGAYD